jgi:hypothetical protein
VYAALSPAAVSPPGGATRQSSLLLPQDQSLALARLQSLTGAHVSLELPGSIDAGRFSGGSGSGNTMVHLTAGELPTISGLALSPSGRLQHAIAAAAGLVVTPRQGRHEGDDAGAGASAGSVRSSRISAGEPPFSPIARRPPLPPKSLDLARLRMSTDDGPPSVRRSSGNSLCLSPIDLPVRWSSDSAAGAGPKGSLSAWSSDSSGRLSSGGGHGLRLSLDPAFKSPFATEAHVGFASDEEDDFAGGFEDALVEQLAAEAAADVDAGAAFAMPARLTEMSRQLVDIAASLSPANASMLLDRGYSLVVPVLPASILEHTLVARPNFKLRWVGGGGGWVGASIARFGSSAGAARSARDCDGDSTQAGHRWRCQHG